jgi:uncharacterized protein (DUF2252 family)
MDDCMRRQWQRDLRKNHSKSIDAPLWLWSSIVELVGNHETSYLEHCRMHCVAANRKGARHALAIRQS